MSDYITVELRFFLISIVTGIAILVIYDILRIFRRIIKHNWFFVALEDVLFWIASGVVIFIMMYEQNNGIIRGFSILGMLLGMIVYNQSISSYFVDGSSKGLNFIKSMIRKVIHIILIPVRWVAKKLGRIGSKIKAKVSKLLNKKKAVLKTRPKKSKIKDKKK